MNYFLRGGFWLHSGHRERLKKKFLKYGADALETLAGAIQTAQAGGITTIGSTDQTITVSGAGNTRDIKVNVANIVKASGSSLINDSGKLDLAWIEVA